MKPLVDVPHFVYRYYDVDDCLVYVGCTTDMERREQDHRYHSWWYPLVVRSTVTEYPNDDVALSVEAKAALTEYPRFNIQGRGGRAFRVYWAIEQYEDYYAALIHSKRSTSHRTRDWAQRTADEAFVRFGVRIEESA